MGSYTLFLIGSLLFVNMIYCNDLESQENSNMNKRIQIDRPVFDENKQSFDQKLTDESKAAKRLKRAASIKEDLKKNPKQVAREKFLERAEPYRQSYKDNPPLYRFKNGPNYQNSFKALNSCREILYPEIGVTYPWFYPRLPLDLEPVHYDLEIYTPFFQVPLYDGIVEIEIKVLKETDTILLHTKLSFGFLLGVIDNNNKELIPRCDGEFFANDYYIIRFNQTLKLAQSPIKIAFLFFGFLDIYETGLFEFNFENYGRKGSEFFSNEYFCFIILKNIFYFIEA
jgi:hypothetical protein